MFHDNKLQAHICHNSDPNHSISISIDPCNSNRNHDHVDEVPASYKHVLDEITTVRFDNRPVGCVLLCCSYASEWNSQCLPEAGSECTSVNVLLISVTRFPCHAFCHFETCSLKQCYKNMFNHLWICDNENMYISRDPSVCTSLH